MNGANLALERVTRVPGVRGSLLISADDGLVVAERLMDGIDGRAIGGAGMRAPTFVHLRGNAGSVLAAPGRYDLVLVAVMAPDANLGLARLEMLDVVGHLA
jgi:predicted regulator of Ras-like GTPase activity (Roadblock/LC7/MglB family)